MIALRLLDVISGDRDLNEKSTNIKRLHNPRLSQIYLGLNRPLLARLS